LQSRTNANIVLTQYPWIEWRIPRWCALLLEVIMDIGKELNVLPSIGNLRLWRHCCDKVPILHFRSVKELVTLEIALHLVNALEGCSVRRLASNPMVVR